MLRSACGKTGLEIRSEHENDSFPLKLLAFSMHSSHYA